MKISTRGRYALRVMVELARQGDETFVPLKLISQKQEISMKYLESIVAVLQKAGFLVSLRGKAGGYKLAKPANEYSVGAVLKLTEGSLAPVACLDEPAILCERAESCPTLPMWKRLDAIIDSYLEGVSIEDLAAGCDAGGDYCI